MQTIVLDALKEITMLYNRRIEILYFVSGFKKAFKNWCRSKIETLLLKISHLIKKEVMCKPDAITVDRWLSQT